MKKQILLLIMCLFSLISEAQRSQIVTSSMDLSDWYESEIFELKNLREVRSGSRIIVNYADNVPVEMKGAFGYAAKLWEEVLPFTLPIIVDVKYDKTVSSDLQFSTVNMPVCKFYGEHSNNYLAPLSQIKAVVLQEHFSKDQLRFFDEITDVENLKGTDMTITYTGNCMNECSFSLDGTPDLNKYDFVTIALRDIAVGLGMTSFISGDVSKREIEIKDDYLCIPFESCVFSAMKSRVPTQAYINATKGTLPFLTSIWETTSPLSLELYAPDPWENGVSLKYFIPGNNPVSRILCCDLHRGYVCRDLTGIDWNLFFTKCLDWRKEIAVGIGGSNSLPLSITGSSDDILPFKGTVSLTMDDNIAANNSVVEISDSQSDSQDVVEEPTIKSNINYDVVEEIEKFCDQFHPFSTTSPNSVGYTLSVLKNDGTWDQVAFFYHYTQLEDIDMDNLPLHFTESEYARTISGGLRYRLSRCDDNGHYTTKYYIRSFTPQIPEINYSQVHIDPDQISTLSTLSSFDVNIEIGLANIEGAKRVVVEQLDEGQRLPLRMEVSDFRNGYFTATVDRDKTSTFRVISYNENGSRMSNTITVAPVGISEREITTEIINDEIILYGLSQDLIDSGKITYAFHRYMDEFYMTYPLQLTSNKIKIPEKIEGHQALVLYYNEKAICVGKFYFPKVNGNIIYP